MYDSLWHDGLQHERPSGVYSKSRPLSSIALLPWLPDFPPQIFSHHNLLPHIPSICLSTVNSSPHPGIVPQFLNSSSQTLPSSRLASLPRDCLILIPFRQPQIHCFSLKCFSSDSDNCPDVGIGPLLQFPHWPRAGPVLLKWSEVTQSNSLWPHGL